MGIADLEKAKKVLSDYVKLPGMAEREIAYHLINSSDHHFPDAPEGYYTIAGDTLVKEKGLTPVFTIKTKG